MEPDPLAESAAEVAAWEATARGLGPVAVASVPIAEKKYFMSREFPALIKAVKMVRG
jgi:hypothetical protein